MPSLFVIQGRDQGKRFELNEKTVSVGRDVSNRVRLHDTEVSRRHAELCQTAEGFVWRDLESSNGSFVNSVRVDSHTLQSGDRIQVGRTLMIFTASADRASDTLRHDVDIVKQSDTGRPSRIVTSVKPQSEDDVVSHEHHAGEEWLARARSNLQVMYRTALAVSHTMDIDQLLQRIMELIFEWVEADRGVIMLIDRDTEEFLPKVRLDRKASESDTRMAISRTILDYVRTRQEGVLTSDAREDDRWDPAVSILKLGVREAICVPMQGRYGMVGVIYIDTYTPPGEHLQRQTPNRFTGDHLKLMVAIGHQAALAVEDTSYYSAMLQAERLAAIGQTIAGLSHHVKNILQGIRGGSFLIEEGLKAADWEITQKGWSIVDKNQERISGLVMDMLSFSKEREPDWAPADLNQVVGDVLELMQARARTDQVTLEDARLDAVPTMSFDADGIHRALLNVISNAIDACHETENACVRVETAYDETAQLLRVSVRDNGPGIEPDQLKRIFQVFVSGKGNRGTGLGLAVSQKILREHNGDILVESTPGAGATFVLQWPAVPVEQTVPFVTRLNLTEDGDEV